MVKLKYFLIITPFVEVNTSKNVSFYLFSNTNTTATYNLSLSEGIRDIVQLKSYSLTVVPEERTDLDFEIIIPDEYSTGIITGSLILSIPNGGSRELPISIEIVNESLLSIDLTLNEPFFSDLESSFFLNNLEQEVFIGNVTYIIENSPDTELNNSVYITFNESFTFENGKIYEKSFDFEELGYFLEDGIYDFTVFVETPNLVSSTSDSFQYTRSFWTVQRQWFAFFFILIILLSYLAYLGITRYRAYKFKN